MYKERQYLLFALFVGFALYAFANQRTVSIPYGPSGITLSNGSPVPVDYNITCYNGAGASTNLGSTNLSARGTYNLMLQSSHSCAQGAPNFTNEFTGGTMVACQYTNVSSAAGTCAAGYHLCSYAEVSAQVSGSTNRYIFAQSDYSNLFYKRANSTSGWGQYTLSSGSGPMYQAGSTQCNKGNTNDSGQNVNNCTASTYGHPVCCLSSPLFMASTCEVTVEGTTAAGGFLQSPSFKSNSPF